MAEAPTAKTEVLITIEDAGQRLALSCAKIYQLINAGELTPIRIGRACRLLADEVARFPQRYIANERTRPV